MDGTQEETAASRTGYSGGFNTNPGGLIVSISELIPLSALDRPIAYHKIFRHVAGSTVAGVFLSQAWYWTKTLPNEREGWFYKTREEWEEETGLTRREQETARKHLKERQLIEEQRRGIDPTLWFRIDVWHLTNLINQRTSPDGASVPQERAECAITYGRNAPSPHITETTSREYRTEREGKRSHRKPESPLPEDFTLSDSRLSYAIEKGMDDKRARIQFERLRNWAISKDERKRDWDATWRNWVLSDIEKHGPSTPTVKRIVV